MHIPDGYLSPQTYLPLWGAIIPLWGIAARKLKARVRTRQVPLLALAAAFSFTVMLFNIPLPGGTTGHATGGALIAILLGPWTACITISLTLIIQALLFGDGGITSLGANCFTMAVIIPFVGHCTYRLLSGNGAAGGPRRAAAGFVAGFLALNTAALYNALLLGLQPIIAVAADGRPLYAPYPLAITVPAMAVGHLLFCGPVEGMATALVIKYIQGSSPALLPIAGVEGERGGGLRRLWQGVGVLAVLSPLGLIIPAVLGSGTAWGEWGPAELAARIGFVPEGMARLTALWRAPLADYALGGGGGMIVPALGYGVCGAVGVGVSICAVRVCCRLTARDEK